MDSALILALETATGCGSVALTRGLGFDAYVVAECTCRPEVSHSRRLLGSVEWVMESAGASWDDIDGIAVSLGPGSFTGLRIGLSAAKGLVMATGKPLLAVPTLDALALCYSGEAELIGCLLDARREEVYAALYRPGKGPLPEIVGNYRAVSPEALAEELDCPVVLLGSGAQLYANLFGAKEQISVINSISAHPRAAHIGFIGAHMLNQGQIADPVTVAPLYVRASEAEINLRKKNLKKQAEAK